MTKVMKLKLKDQVGQGAATATYQSEEQKLVDEYVELSQSIQRRMAEIAPDSARLAEMQQKLVALADERWKPDAKGTLFGTGGRMIAFGERARERTVRDAKAALAALKKAVGANVWSLVKVSLGTLDKYLTPDQLSELVDEQRTGRRSMKVIGAEAPE